jgi:hypothetical protein
VFPKAQLVLESLVRILNRVRLRVEIYGVNQFTAPTHKVEVNRQRPSAAD